MHRPLRVPLHLRVWNLIKGVLFYNTWNWDKASDGLNMPTISREERERARPKADLEIIKPREKPRARLDLRKKSNIPQGNYQTQVSEPEPEPEPVFDPREETEHEMHVREAAPAAAAHPEGEYIKRRKYKRRRSRSSSGGEGFFRRVFGRESGPD